MTSSLRQEKDIIQEPLLVTDSDEAAHSITIFHPISGMYICFGKEDF
jgi:hypothetical protein